MYLVIVEDDPIIADGLSTGLRQAGHTAGHVAAAADAALTGRHNFDAVVLDLGLPDGSGLEVLRALRRRGGTTPVLVLTAHDTVGDRIRGLDSSAADFPEQAL